MAEENAQATPLGSEPWRSIEPDAVGIRNTTNLVQAWSVREGTSVDVRAERHSQGGEAPVWGFVATVDCEKAVIGVVYGGVNRAKRVCKEIRNALLAVRLRRRHYKMNREARQARPASEEVK